MSTQPMSDLDDPLGLRRFPSTGSRAPIDPERPIYAGHQAAPPPSIAMPSGGMPNLPPVSLPSVEAPRGTSAGDEAELSRKLSTGSGISQIPGKIEGSDFGQNHPILGKIAGNALGAIARLGDVGLSAVAPALAINLPGTEYHHRELVNQDRKQVAQDTANEGRQAETSAAQAEVPLRQAETAEAQAKTEAVQNAPEKESTLAQLHANAVNKAIQEGRDPSEDPTVNHLADAITSLQKQAAPKEATPAAELQRKLIDAENSGDASGATKLKQQLKDLNPLGEQRLGVTIANQASKADPAVERAHTRSSGSIEKLFESAQKQRDSLDQAQTELDSGAIGQSLGTIKSLTGLAGGQGSGVRITQAELNSIAHARGIAGDFNGFISKIEGEGALDQQKQLPQLKALLSAVDAKLKEKQSVYDSTLDKLDGAQSVQELRKIESDFRKQVMNGSGGAQAGGGKDGKGSAAPPAGATHIAPGSDGHSHYTDGKNDLGIAP